jgi:CubicO group peptidase (beta-lactamase class C family)
MIIDTIVSTTRRRLMGVTSMLLVIALALSGCSSEASGPSAGSADSGAPDTDTASTDGQTNPDNDDEADQQLVDVILDDWLTDAPDGATTSASLAFSRPGQEPIVALSGEREGAALVGDELFRLGSIAKTYVATALLRLASEGAIDLDAPIDTWVDDVPGAAFLTPRQLLNQTSGLPDFIANDAWLEAVSSDPQRSWTARDALELIDPADPTPDGFSYSNTNYVVLGLVLEAATSSTVRDVIAEQVLEPLGLEDTDMDSTGRRIVDGVIDVGDGTVVSTDELPAYTAFETSAGTAGSVVATPADLTRFGRALLDRGFLPVDAWAQMTTFGDDGIYGLGIADMQVVSGGQLTGYGNLGEIPGYQALLIVDPATETVLVALSGDDRADVFDLGIALQQALRNQASTVDGSEPAPDDDPRAATAARFTGIDDDGPGCTVAVAKDGEIVFADAYGQADLDAGAPMTTDTIVDVGSVAKQFTATAALLLVERGDVALDAPLSAYLEDLPAWGARVSVAEAMQHTSGIPDYIERLAAAGAAITDELGTDDALDALQGTELEFVPGTRLEYSNSNYLLLGEVVAAVTGRPLAEVLHDEVFRPAGVDAVVAPVRRLEGEAVSYTAEGAGAWSAIDANWSMVGDGGVKTTPTQLVTWASQYWAPTLGGPEMVQLRAAVIAAGQTASGDAEADRYGAGTWHSEVDGLGSVTSHFGEWEGFVSVLAALPAARLAVAASCTAPELPPVRADLGFDLLRLWS